MICLERGRLAGRLDDSCLAYGKLLVMLWRAGFGFHPWCARKRNSFCVIGSPSFRCHQRYHVAYSSIFAWYHATCIVSGPRTAITVGKRVGCFGAASVLPYSTGICLQILWKVRGGFCQLLKFVLDQSTRGIYIPGLRLKSARNLTVCNTYSLMVWDPSWNEQYIFYDLSSPFQRRCIIQPNHWNFIEYFWLANYFCPVLYVSGCTVQIGWYLMDSQSWMDSLIYRSEGTRLYCCWAFR